MTALSCIAVGLSVILVGGAVLGLIFVAVARICIFLHSLLPARIQHTVYPESIFVMLLSLGGLLILVHNLGCWILTGHH